MPSHMVHSALTQLYVMHDGAPWGYPCWQRITGVKHGLFPDDDSLLPEGWTRETANLIGLYFDQYQKLRTEDERIKFSSSRRGSIRVAGRDLWRNWVTELWQKRKIHAEITEILKVKNLHPLTLALSDGSGLDDVPHNSTYLPLAVDDVARSLFGEEACNSLGLLRTGLRSPTLALMQRTWINIYNQLQRTSKRLVALEKGAMDAFDGLSKDTPTKRQISSVILKVSRWKAAAESLQMEQALERVSCIEAELTQLMAGLGAVLDAKVSIQELTKVTHAALQTLASEQDVADVLSLYREFFDSFGRDDNVELQGQQPAFSYRFGEAIDGSDPGVEVEMGLSPADLEHNLGFLDGLPVVFNRYRHCGGLTSWDPTHAAEFAPERAQNNPDMVPIELHWHQKAGVHAMFRMVFKPVPAVGACTGVLVADDVGLGKTFQAITAVAILAECVVRQAVGKELPPFFEKNPFLGDKREIPDLPHLFLVPGTLLSQWEVEVRTLFRGGSFDILLYGTGKAQHEAFWGPEGDFSKSKHKLRNVIILASHSSLLQDYSLIYAKPSSEKLPWEDPTPLPSYKLLVGSTLYGRQYLSVTIDEAHGFRNVGTKGSAALSLSKQAVFRQIMTGTPLQTSTKDVASMGRLVGIPHFFSEDALAEEKSDATVIRRSRGDDSVDGPVEIDSAVVDIAQRMQRQFQGRILRRTKESLDWKKQCLVPLPPHEENLVILNLTAREMEVISELADKVKER